MMHRRRLQAACFLILMLQSTVDKSVAEGDKHRSDTRKKSANSQKTANNIVESTKVVLNLKRYDKDHVDYSYVFTRGDPTTSKGHDYEMTPDGEGNDDANLGQTTIPKGNIGKLMKRANLAELKPADLDYMTMTLKNANLRITKDGDIEVVDGTLYVDASKESVPSNEASKDDSTTTTEAATTTAATTTEAETTTTEAETTTEKVETRRMFPITKEKENSARAEANKTVNQPDDFRTKSDVPSNDGDGGGDDESMEVIYREGDRVPLEEIQKSMTLVNSTTAVNDSPSADTDGSSDDQAVEVPSLDSGAAETGNDMNSKNPPKEMAVYDYDFDGGVPVPCRSSAGVSKNCRPAAHPGN